jgi:hypothetical protein
MEPQSRIKKNLVIEIVLDADDSFNPKYLCFRNAGIDADRMFARGQDEIVWACERAFTIEFVRVVGGEKVPLGSAPFEGWTSGSRASTNAGGENTVAGSIDSVKKGGSGKVWNYKITVEGAPVPLDPQIIIET